MSAEGWSRFDPGEEDLSFVTDLYQLTMAAAYHRRGGARRGSFELTVRSLPPGRNFLVFAGLETALEALGSLRFTEQQIAFVRALPPFAGIGDSFFDHLRDLRFGCDVWAMEEGSVFFPGEPVLRVSGDLIEAQIVETLLLSIINFQTAVASKAARIRLVAGDDVELAEFGTRRAHGPQAALWAARAAYLAGFDSTSNVLAGQRLDIPVVGTMAHSFVMAARGESEAFLDYQRAFPAYAIFLVDTYDTLEAVDKVLDLGVEFTGIRLDSGDVLELSRQARKRLDDGGADSALIFASGDLDEWAIARLRRAAAPIDAYGIGSKLSTSADAPYIGGVYKLVEVLEDGRVRYSFKSSAGKTTYPGRKQVLRFGEDAFTEDVLTLDDVAASEQGGGRRLLDRVMREGRRTDGGSLQAARRRCAADLASLPAALRGLDSPAEPYPVHIDSALEELLEQCRREIEA